MQCIVNAVQPLTGGIALSGWAEKIRKSALQEMLAKASEPGILSFALGLPAGRAVPIRGYRTIRKQCAGGKSTCFAVWPTVPSAETACRRVDGKAGCGVHR